ncbi:MAG: pteridine reductase [Gammaproteobacteria bacterium]
MTNKTVLITGGAQRIGAAIARDLHAHGLDLVIHYNTSKDEAETFADSLNAERAGSVCLLQADLLNDREIFGLVTDAHDFKNRLDILINNASSFYPTPVNSVTTAQWNDLIGTNLKAPFFLAQRAADYLRESRGCVINMTDIHAERPLKNHAVYSTAKAGLVMLTKALAKDLGPEIRVNAISPGAILWPQQMDDETRKEILSRTILRRQGEQRDINNAIRYLIFDADYMTGQVLTIDGGRTLFS